MIAVDTNLPVYAHRRESRAHAAAQSVMRTLAEGDAPWAIPRPCRYEFPSVVTNHRIWKGDATPPDRRGAPDSARRGALTAPDSASTTRVRTHRAIAAPIRGHEKRKRGIACDES